MTTKTKTRHGKRGKGNAKPMIVICCNHCGSANLASAGENDCYWCHQSLYGSKQREISSNSYAGKELREKARKH